MVRPSQHGCGLALRHFQQLPISDNVGDAKAWHSSLPRTEEFSRAPDFQIEFRDFESIVGSRHGVEALLALLADLAAGHQDAIRFCAASADAAPQLVKLCQSEALRVLDDHDSSIRYINANFNDRSRH